MKHLLIFFIFILLIAAAKPATATNVTLSEVSYISGTGTDNSLRSPQYGYCLPIRPYVNVDQGTPLYTSVTVAAANWQGSALDSRYDTDVQFQISGTTVANGSVGFSKSGDGTEYYIQIWFWDVDGFASYSGWQLMTIANWAYSTDIKAKHTISGTSFSNDVITIIANSEGSCGGANLRVSGTHTTNWVYQWTNTFSYFDNSSYYFINWDKTAVDTSKVQITQSNGHILHSESALNSNDFTLMNGTVEYNTWNYYVLNVLGHWQNGSIQFRPDESNATGSLTFDKSNYSYPDGITLTRSLTNTDYDIYAYTIQVIADDAADFSSPQTVKSLTISTNTGLTWISPDEIITSRPYYLKGILREIRKSDGTIRYLDNETAYYSDPLGGIGGKIWTDKTSYLDGEDVLIYYLTYESNNYIAIEGPHELDYLGEGVPGVQGVKTKNLQTGSYGNWTVYLYENGIRANTTTFYVTSNEIFCTWDDDSIALGQLADFGYFSANATAQIRAFDGANNQVYGPATTLAGYHGGLVNTAGTEPGNWTISMYHNGTYYNDSLEVVSTSPWLRFMSNQYKVGETIQIEYYLTDSRNSFTLYDSRMTNVLTWTTTRGAVVVGSRNIVNFTLSDDNEYRIPVASKIDADQYALGFWRVEMFENVYGPPNPNLQQVDTTKILPAATDSTYASEQMFNTMFSIEGLFYIFSCIMVLMGMKIAQHPAGGAAGVVASTAFGAFFGIVPTWILYLMVITLVILAGITVSAYFRK